MKIKMRLYRQHDLDLVGLYIHPDIKFRDIVVNSLKAHIRDEDFLVSIPESLDLRKKTSNRIQLNISLDDDKDSDIISWLSNIRTGYRNSMLKNITRSYLSKPFTKIYQEKLNEEEMENRIKASTRKTKLVHTKETSPSDKVNVTKDDISANTKKSTEIPISSIKSVRKEVVPSNETFKEKPLQTMNHAHIIDDSIDSFIDEDDPLDLFESMMNSFE